MIDFQRITPENRDRYLEAANKYHPGSCCYSFANMCLWNDKYMACFPNDIGLMMRFGEHMRYIFPVGGGDPAAVVDAYVEDARERGVPFNMFGLNEANCEMLENSFPGRFAFHRTRNNDNYVYDINDLADLAGSKYRTIRYHANRFAASHPKYCLIPLTFEKLNEAKLLTDRWFTLRAETTPDEDFSKEQEALLRAFDNYDALHMEGALLADGKDVLAMEVCSPLAADTLDCHFWKALHPNDGTYAMLHREFSRMIRERHPEIRFMNWEEDMGHEAIRQSKLRYHPHHMEEVYWTRLKEDE